MPKTVVKSFFYLDDNYQKGFKLSKMSPYQHIASNSYRYYLQRRPKALYITDAKHIINQGLKIQDQNLIDKGKLKLEAIKNEKIKFFELINGKKVQFQDNHLLNDFDPVHICLIISPDYYSYLPPLYPLDYLHYLYLDITKTLKHKQNLSALWNYYGAYHPDTKHPHYHLVLYQNEVGFKNKPLNTLNKARQVYSSATLKQIKANLNHLQNQKDISFAFSNEIVDKLIKKIKHFNASNLTSKQIFVLKWLLKALNVKQKDLSFKKEYSHLYNILINHHNYYASAKSNEDLKQKLNKQVINNSHTYSLALLLNHNDNNYKKQENLFFKDIVLSLQQDGNKNQVKQEILNIINKNERRK